MTWKDEVQKLNETLGRKPTLDELVERAKTYTMTDEERREQQASFVRGMMPTGDPRFD